MVVFVFATGSTTLFFSFAIFANHNLNLLYKHPSLLGMGAKGNVPNAVAAKKKRRFFIDPEKDQIYEARWKTYKQLLEALYPDTFNWDLHNTMVKELSRMEIEREVYDRLILNDMENLWLSKRRTELANLCASWRKDLGITIPLIKRLMANSDDKPKDFLSAFEKQLDNWQAGIEA